MFKAFVFPTFFVFVAAIIVLYIPLFFVNKIQNKGNFLIAAGSVLLLWLYTYIFVFDKSSYEMNNTNIPMIAFPYFTCMCLGAYLRKFEIKERGILQRIVFFILCFVFSILYYVITKSVRADESLNSIQIIVQLSLLFATAFMAYTFLSSEQLFKRLPKTLLCVINFIAALTIEIYVVQKPIIQTLEVSTKLVNYNYIDYTCCYYVKNCGEFFS